MNRKIYDSKKGSKPTVVSYEVYEKLANDYQELLEKYNTVVQDKYFIMECATKYLKWLNDETEETEKLRQQIKNMRRMADGKCIIKMF